MLPASQAAIVAAGRVNVQLMMRMMYASVVARMRKNKPARE
jgi:hypothetical protein